MIPIGDVNPRRRVPIITIGLILINALVFIYQLTLPAEKLESFYYSAGVVPYNLTNNLQLPAVMSIFTSMFMHGGFMHIAGNMLYLWIFGDNIEDQLGRMGYLAFYLGAGVIAALAQVAAAPNSEIPLIGASGAIAGVLGAYLVLFPHTKVRTLLILFRFIRFVQLPAIWVLGFWFVLQIFSGLASLGSLANGGTAWFAHVGGFVTGLLVGTIARRAGSSSYDRSPTRSPSQRPRY